MCVLCYSDFANILSSSRPDLGTILVSLQRLFSHLFLGLPSFLLPTSWPNAEVSHCASSVHFPPLMSPNMLWITKPFHISQFLKLPYLEHPYTFRPSVTMPFPIS